MKDINFKAIYMGFGALWGTWTMIIWTLHSCGLISGMPEYVYLTLMGIFASMVFGDTLVRLKMPSVQFGSHTSSTPPSGGMGGELDDAKQSRLRWVYGIGRKAVIGLVILSLLGTTFMFWYKNYSSDKEIYNLKVKVGMLTELEDDIDLRLVNNKDEAVVYYKDKTGKTRLLRAKHPKGNKPVEKELKDSGKVVENRAAEYMPYMVAIPAIEAIITGKGVQPGIAVEFMRSNGLGMALAADVGADTVGVSISKDVLDNSSIGLGYGIGSALKTHMYAVYRVRF